MPPGLGTQRLLSKHHGVPGSRWPPGCWGGAFAHGDHCVLTKHPAWVVLCLANSKTEIHSPRVSGRPFEEQKASRAPRGEGPRRGLPAGQRCYPGLTWAHRVERCPQLIWQAPGVQESLLCPSVCAGHCRFGGVWAPGSRVSDRGEAWLSPFPPCRL